MPGHDLSAHQDRSEDAARLIYLEAEADRFRSEATNLRARITELLAANTAEVERRRASERDVRHLRDELEFGRANRDALRDELDTVVAELAAERGAKQAAEREAVRLQGVVAKVADMTPYGSFSEHLVEIARAALVSSIPAVEQQGTRVGTEELPKAGDCSFAPRGSAPHVCLYCDMPVNWHKGFIPGSRIPWSDTQPLRDPATTEKHPDSELTLEQRNAAAQTAMRIVRKFPQIEQAVVAPMLALEIGRAILDAAMQSTPAVRERDGDGEKS